MEYNFKTKEVVESITLEVTPKDVVVLYEAMGKHEEGFDVYMILDRLHDELLSKGVL